jgi:hypothetical protein
MKNTKSIMWLDIDIEENQFYILGLFTHTNEEMKIRFPIDKITATGFKSILKQKSFKEKYGNEYSYWYAGYSANRSKTTYEHYVEIRLGKMRHKTKVQCSETFCQNLRWLTETKSVSDLNSLAMNYPAAELRSIEGV